MDDPVNPADLRAAVATALGPVFPGPGLGPATVLETKELDGWCLDDLTFSGAEGEIIPAYFLRPPTGHAPVPALIYAHAHGNNYGIGRDELLTGRPALHAPFAPDMVRAGLATLAIDLPCFGARQVPGESARAKAHLWRGQTLFGQMLAELRGGVDFLADHPGVDASRIGILGFSMGSTLAWWLAGLDTRLRAAAALCSFADIGELVKDGLHDPHGIYMTVPGQMQLARTGQIAGLVAPRALQISVGETDPLTPPQAFAQGLEDVKAAYRSATAIDQLSVLVETGSGHVETPRMRKTVLDFLTKSLCGPS